MSEVHLLEQVLNSVFFIQKDEKNLLNIFVNWHLLLQDEPW